MIPPKRVNINVNVQRLLFSELFMKSDEFTATKKSNLKINLEIAFVFALTIFSFIISMIHLNFPSTRIFDELYRVTRAELFLHKQVFVVDQPPFGRYPMILGILLFGNNPIGWRISQIISRALLVPISYFIGKSIFKHKHAGLLMAFFVTFNLSFLAYSRIGVVVMLEVFLVAISFLLFILSIKDDTKNGKLLFCLSAVLTGFTIATKWTALCLLPIYWLWIKTKTNIKSTFPERLPFKILFLIIVFSAYLLTFAGEKRNFEYYHQAYGMHNSSFLESVISWHKLAIGSHTREGVSHPYSSKWYTWPFMYKPVVLYQDIDKAGKQITSIIGLGNPIVWWLGDLAILFQLFLLLFKRDKTMVFLLGAYFISFLPYAFIQRPMFLYHYLISLFFQMLILEYTFANLYKEKVFLRPALSLLLVLIIFIFFYFYPFINGYPVSTSEYFHRLWFKSWREFQLVNGSNMFFLNAPHP